MSDLLEHPTPFREVAPQFATSGVYAIYCTQTDTYYIGQGQVVLRRLFDHFDALRRGGHQNTLLQTDYNEAGEDCFVVDLLDDMPNAAQQELLVQETKEIQRFKAHGKLLYNKVSTTIKAIQPQPAPARHSTTAAAVNGYERRDREQLLSHAERVVLDETTPATCYDCGEAGYLLATVYVCDDGQVRCQRCIEAHLDQWLLTFKTSETPRTGRQPAKNAAFYRRWLVPKYGSYTEHIMRAAVNFSSKYGYMPTRVYVAPGVDAPESVNGIEVVEGGIATPGYIDILIESG